MWVWMLCASSEGTPWKCFSLELPVSLITMANGTIHLTHFSISHHWYPAMKINFRFKLRPTVFSKFNTLCEQTGKLTYLKPSASIQMKRNDTRQKQQAHHRKILSSQHPGHRDLKATKKRTEVDGQHTSLLELLNLAVEQVAPQIMEPHTSAICMKICWGYRGRSTSYKSLRYATCMYTFSQDTVVRGLKCHLRA